jgi:hypothetical protein
VKTRRRVAAVALVLAVAAPCGAQNLLANPDFDADVAGWSVGTQSFIVATWNAADAADAPDSGSLQLDAATAGFAAQCVPVEAGRTYRVAGQVAPLSSGAGLVGFAFALAWWDTTACDDSLTGAFQQVAATGVTDAWQALEGEFVAPAGTRAAEVRLAANWASGARAARFDALYLPECESAAALAAASIALAGVALRRGRA